VSSLSHAGGWHQRRLEAVPPPLGLLWLPVQGPGKTFAKSGNDCRTEVFSHGQLYVAAGLVCRAEDLFVLVSPERQVGLTDGSTVTLIMNVVYWELLQVPRESWPTRQLLQLRP